MNRKLSVLFLVAVFGFPGYILAQNASGIIARNRMVDWSNAGVQGGIPSRSTVCATLSPGASASQINSAIASCPSNQVVYLNSGTYTLSSGIDFSGHDNVTLRGAGPDKTFINFSGGVSCNQTSADICVAGDAIYSSPSNVGNWTGGLSQGSTQVTISNVTNLRVGDFIEFDQLNDTSDTGNVFVCDASGVCSTEGTGGVYRSNRAQNQVVMVTAISGNTVTISPGIYQDNWSTSKSPQAYWSANPISKVGIENLSINNSSSSSNAGIAFNSAANCWVKNVRSLNPNRDHVWLWHTAHISVVNSYFYGTQRGQVVEYGIEPDMDSDSLIENNIFQHIVSPLLINATSGTVFAYNYTIDDWYTQSSSWLMPGIFPHSAGTAMDLLEGNEASGVESDDVHGTHNLLTFFRNRLLGWQSGMTNNTIPLELSAYSRYYNIIGNVLGQPNYHTQYESIASSGSNCAKSIYVLGWTGSGGCKGSSDSLVASTLMRWGNYDVVTGGVKWDSSEVPSSLSEYANPVPSSHTLPDSFFLYAKPDWWGTPWGNPPWPAIGPDVTGGPGPGGHSYDIPAKLCYANTSKDSNGILNFNADKCYTSSPAPAAPTGLGAVAH